jgi:hypothetical protein
VLCWRSEKHDPAHPRAIAHENLGDLTAAYRDYSKAAELDPDWDAPKKELTRFTVKRP